MRVAQEEWNSGSISHKLLSEQQAELYKYYNFGNTVLKFHQRTLPDYGHSRPKYVTRIITFSF
jgi:hypothetical protein